MYNYMCNVCTCVCMCIYIYIYIDYNTISAASLNLRLFDKDATILSIRLTGNMKPFASSTNMIRCLSCFPELETLEF